MGTLLVDAVPPGGLAATTMERAPVAPTRVLGEGDVIDLGDRAFEVLYLPGHSPREHRVVGDGYIDART